MRKLAFIILILSLILLGTYSDEATTAEIMFMIFAICGSSLALITKE